MFYVSCVRKREKKSDRISGTRRIESGAQFVYVLLQYVLLDGINGIYCSVTLRQVTVFVETQYNHGLSSAQL